MRENTKTIEYPPPKGPTEGNVVGFIQDGATRIYISDAVYAGKPSEQQASERKRFLLVCARAADQLPSL